MVRAHKLHPVVCSGELAVEKWAVDAGASPWAQWGWCHRSPRRSGFLRGTGLLPLPATTLGWAGQGQGCTQGLVKACQSQLSWERGSRAALWLGAGCHCRLCLLCLASTSFKQRSLPGESISFYQLPKGKILLQFCITDGVI